jgi:hypothetical protein
MFRSQSRTCGIEAGKQGTLSEKKRRDMSAAERVGLLQEKLYCNAKQERGYKFRYYLHGKLCRYYHRKSQIRSRLYGQLAFDILVNKFALIDPMKYFVKSSPVKACSEDYRKAVCGKTARTV